MSDLMSQVIKSFASEEQLALRAPADFLAILPLEQAVASGIDGRLSPGDSWTLRSTSVDFQMQGVESGQLVRLSLATGPLPSPGQLYVVESVSGNAISIRRMGQPGGVGQPPAPLSGLEEVEFLIVTFMPQLVQSSEDVASRLGLASVGGALCDPIRDTHTVRDLTILKVLYQLYEAASLRSESEIDGYSRLSMHFQAEYNDRLSRLVSSCGSGQPAAEAGRVIRYLTRLSR